MMSDLYNIAGWIGNKFGIAATKMLNWYISNF